MTPPPAYSGPTPVPALPSKPQGAPRWSLTGLLLTGFVLCACSPMPAGVVGHAAFLSDSVVLKLQGSAPLTVAAQCFENEARFLHLSEFSRDAAAGTFTYRLRWSATWYEQVQLSSQGGVTMAEARIAANLDGRWQRQYETDRLAPLRACLKV